MGGEQNDDNSFSLYGNVYDSIYKGFIVQTDANGNTRCDSEPLSIKFEDIDLKVKDVDYTLSDDTLIAEDVQIQSEDITHLFSQKTYCTNFEPTAQLSDDTLLCYGATLTLDATLVNGLPVNVSPETTFEWSTGDSTSQVNIKESGKYWVKITKGACESWDSINVKFLREIFLDLGDDSMICPHDSILLDAGNAGINFQWFLPSGDTAYGRTLFSFDSGKYRVRVAKAGGCVDLDTVAINFYPLPKTDAGPDTTMCYGNTVTLRGKGGITYKWEPAQYLNNQFLQKPNASPPDSQLYLLITSNQFGCSDTDFVKLDVFPPLVAFADPFRPYLCPGEDLTMKIIDEDGGHPENKYQYAWHSLSGELLSGTREFSVKGEKINDDTSFVFKLEDGCSVPFQDTVKVEVDQPPSINLVAEPGSGCQPLEVVFKGIGNGSDNLEWSINGNKFKGSQINYLFKKPGNYEVKASIETDSGCVFRDFFKKEITVFPTPAAKFRYLPHYANVDAPGISFFNQSSGHDRSLWKFQYGDSILNTSIYRNPIYSFPDSGNYPVKLIVSNQWDCTDSVINFIRIHPVYNLFIPEIFHPGGSVKTNLEFGPVGRGIREYQLMIFNRWGEKIHDGGTAWDGTFNGKPCEAGVYLFRTIVTSFDGKVEYRQGKVSLLR